MIRKRDGKKDFFVDRFVVRTRVAARKPVIKSMEDSISFGFLDVHFSEHLGFAGGLLLVNQEARPLEFHCTTPVPLNRTEKILYGATYKSHVCCDLIGATLIEKSSTAPELLLVEQPELMELAGRIASPILLLAESCYCDSGLHDVQYPEMLIDGVEVQVLTKDIEQFEFVRAACERFTSSVSLDEPFERIRSAIREAHQSAIKAA